jgi:predicted metal-binding protein
MTELDATQLGTTETLQTKRRKLAHVLVCNGCCCGRTDKGRPEVPLEFLKSEWKNRKLLKSVQLTVAGCLGPCDLANVVSVQTMDETIYLGKLTTLEEYELLLEWATRCTEQDSILPLPERFATKQFEQFRESSNLSAASPHSTATSRSTATLSPAQRPRHSGNVGDVSTQPKPNQQLNAAK